jgi:hypothetical protein
LELGLRLSHGPLAGEQSVVDAHRDDSKRFVVLADEKLTAFLELESAIRNDGIMWPVEKLRGVRDFLTVLVAA